MKQKRLNIQIVNSFQLKKIENLDQYTTFVSNLFTYSLPNVQIKATHRLIIEFSDSPNLGIIIPAELGQSIYTIQKNTDFCNFDKLSTLEKKKFIVEVVYECLLELYRFLGLKEEDVTLAYQTILSNNFVLVVELCRGAKQNKEKTAIALVSAIYFLEYAVIRVAIYDKRKNINRQTDLFETVPVHFVYSQLVTSAKWINNRIFAIFNNSNELVINMDVDGTYSVTYNPKDREVEDIKNEVRFLTKAVLIKL
jgi:hypothetical protein